MTTQSQDDPNLTGFDTSDDLDSFAADFLHGSTDHNRKRVETPEEPVIEAEAEEPEIDETDDIVEDADANDTDENDEEEAPVEEKPKKKSVQDRINEITAQRYEDKRAADARIAELERKLQERETEKPQPKAVESTEGPDPLAENEDGTLKYPMGEYDPAFVRDIAIHAVKQEQKAAETYRKQSEQEAQINAARQTAQTEWLGRVDEVKTEIPDIVDKIKSLDTVVAQADVGYQQYLVDVIMSLDNGPRVMAYLADNLDQAQKIVSSGAASATVALGRLDGKMAKAPAEKKIVTQAPKPAVRTPRGTSGQFSMRGDENDLDAFAREFLKK